MSAVGWRETSPRSTRVLLVAFWDNLCTPAGSYRDAYYRSSDPLFGLSGAAEVPVAGVARERNGQSAGAAGV